MSERFEIEIKFSKKDLWRFTLSRYFSFNHILFSFLGFAIFGLGLGMLFLRGFFSIPHIIDTLITAALFTIFYMLVMTYISANNSESYVGNSFKYIFTNDEIIVSDNSFKTNIKWNYFFRVKENAKFFTLYLKNGDMQFIPKRYFQENELAGFKNLLWEKLGNEAYLKKAKGNLGLK